MNTARPDPAPPPTWRRPIAVIAVVVALLIGFAATTVTGLPGPDWLHRYPRSDLDRLADRINALPPLPASCDGYFSPRVHVDLLRSRVVVDQRGHTSMAFTAGEQAMLDGGPFSRPICGGPS